MRINNKIHRMALKRQKGFTLTGWIVVITLVLFFAYLGMIVTPHVMDSFTIDRIMKGLDEEPDITKKSKKDIRRLIYNRININQIKGISAGDFEVEKADGIVKLYLEYDAKIHVMKNVYILVEHSKMVELYGN